jgi:hypothetical protein
VAASDTAASRMSKYAGSFYAVFLYPDITDTGKNLEQSNKIHLQRFDIIIMAVLDPAIVFLAMARASDKVILCTHCPANSVNMDMYLPSVECVLGSNRFHAVVAGHQHSQECVVGETKTMLHFTKDTDNFVFFVIASVVYPIRVAFKLLAAMQVQIRAKYPMTKLLALKAHALSKPCAKMLDTVVVSFADPSAVDKLSAVQAHVNHIVSTMEINLGQVLVSTERMELMTEKSLDLHHRAQIFKKKGNETANTLWWRKWGWNISIAFAIVLFVAMLLIISGIVHEGDSTTSAAAAVAKAGMWLCLAILAVVLVYAGVKSGYCVRACMWILGCRKNPEERLRLV